MTTARTIRMVVLVLAASCAAVAEQPGVWYPAQQAPTSPSPSAQNPPAPDQQAGASATAPSGKKSDDPRLDQPLQPLESAATQESSSLPAKALETTGAPMAPDTTPLNSPQQLTLGTPGDGGRGFILPSLRVTQYGMMNSSVTGWDTTAVTNLAATAELSQNWSRSSLHFTYTGGGMLFPSDSSLNSAYQQASVQYGMRINHWNLSLSDQGSYLPESAFGFFAVTNGGINMGLGNQYTSNQTILTDATQLSNTVAGTVSYGLTARSNLHFSGTYSMLRFQGGNGTLGNSDTLTYSGGYDRSFGSNTLGVSYIGSTYSYASSSGSMRTDSVNIAFGRRITGRLAWQIAGGPQVNSSDVPSLGTQRMADWNLHTALTYQAGRVQLNSTFMRSVTAGVGAAGGMETYEWLAGVSRPLGRQFQGQASFGIARNATLQQASLLENHFQSEFLSAQVSRVISREMNMFVSYNYQHQSSDFVACTGCSNTFDRHVFGAGFQWQGRPLAFNPF